MTYINELQEILEKELNRTGFQVFIGEKRPSAGWYRLSEEKTFRPEIHAMASRVIAATGLMIFVHKIKLEDIPYNFLIECKTIKAYNRVRQYLTRNDLKMTSHRKFIFCDELPSTHFSDTEIFILKKLSEV